MGAKCKERSKAQDFVFGLRVTVAIATGLLENGAKVHS